MKCELCGKELKDFRNHLKLHPEISSKEYYDRFLKKDGEGICLVCGKPTNFQRISRGYSKFCSYRCTRLGHPDVSEGGYINLTGQQFGKLLVLYRTSDYIEPSTKKHKVVWHCKCDCGKECDVRASSLRSGQKSCGCLITNPIVKKSDSLATKNPKHSRDWDYQKNKNTTPQQVASNSNKTMWWTCPKGHSYQMSVNEKTHSKGCPYCLNRRVLSGFNDFATKAPYLLNEWDYTKNTILPTEVTVKSHRKVWWICPFGHSYKASLLNRNGISHSGCPICNKMTSFPEQALYFYIKQYFPDTENANKAVIGEELDIYIPSLKIAIEYDGIAWHKTKKVKEQKKNKLCIKNNIQLIRIREEGLPLYNDCFCIIRKNYNKNSSLNKCIFEVFHLINPNLVVSVDVDKDIGKIYQSYIFNKKERSLGNVYPDIASEWHPTKNGKITPYMVSPCSNKSFWWLGNCGHEWQTKVASRTKQKSGCPICSGRQILIGVNDLFTKFPKLREEWCFELNDKNGIYPTKVTVCNSSKKCWWKCPKCGELYQSLISNRTRGHGCPYCAKQIPKKGVGDLETVFPDISKEWHPIKNNELKPSEVSPYSKKKVWWKCLVCNYEWEASVNSRVICKYGCPKCAKQSHYKKVICVETGKVYQSIKEASVDTGIQSPNIIMCCQGKSKTIKGLHWKYYTEQESE